MWFLGKCLGPLKLLDFGKWLFKKRIRARWKSVDFFPGLANSSALEEKRVRQAETHQC